MLKKTFFSLLIILCFIQNTKAQWVQVLGASLVRSIVHNGNYILAASQTNGIYISTDNGTTWTLNTLGTQPISLVVSGNNIFAGTNPLTGVYLSTNNGANWTQTSYNNWTVGQLASNGSYVFANAVSGITGYGVFSTTNNGANWNQSLNGQWIRALAANGNNIFAGASNNGVFKSTDNAQSWTQTSLNNRTLNALAVNGNNVFAGTYQYGVYISTDNGINWTQSSLGGSDMHVWSLTLNGNYIFAGTNNLAGNNPNIFVSSDNGTTWTTRSEGLSGNFIYSLRIVNNYIFAGTENSIFRRLLVELTGIQPIENEAPTKYYLSQNCPNPFNPTTKIRFQIPKSGLMELKIYDMLGREVAVLVNEQLNPGTYEIDWDGSNYPSGVYYYKLSAGDFTETRKMLLVK